MVQGGPKKNSELNELHGNPGNRKGKAEPEEKVGNAENYRYIVPTYLRGDQKRYVKPDMGGADPGGSVPWWSETVH